ncbi:MAG: zinc-finger domain-containing protein [Alphaproteobacteria bacterium]|nr:zinc-finger domain-containing protein [Alphaproteobacteria bacterium]
MNPQKNSAFNVLHVDSKEVSCDGSVADSKHPLVYLKINENGFVICPYCSKKFQLNKTGKKHA